MSDPHVDRRGFLQELALLAGAPLVPLPFAGCRWCSSPSVEHARSLNEHEWSVIEEASSRLVPTDDLPGAREANVVGFIDAQLANPNFAVFCREVRLGVSALDALAHERFGSPFDEVAPAGQDAVLAAIQAGEASNAKLRSAHFFQVLFTLTIEGLLSDPAHGGNAGEVGWRIIGYSPSPPHPHRSHG